MTWWYFKILQSITRRKYYQCKSWTTIIPPCSELRSSGLWFILSCLSINNYEEHYSQTFNTRMERETSWCNSTTSKRRPPTPRPRTIPYLLDVGQDGDDSLSHRSLLRSSSSRSSHHVHPEGGGGTTARRYMIVLLVFIIKPPQNNRLCSCIYVKGKLVKSKLSVHSRFGGNITNHHFQKTQ